MSPAGGFQLRERSEPHGRMRLTLLDQAGGQDVAASWLTIDPVVLHDGLGGLVRCGGIGNVETMPAYRRRGLAARLLQLAVDRMRQEGFEASLLYGIDDYYDRFGWRSCGDERWARIPLGQRMAPNDDAVTMRDIQPGDLPEVAALHERLAATIAGSASRPLDGRVWAQLVPGDARVARRAGIVVGWSWRGLHGPAERGRVAAREPRALVLAELQATDHGAALVLAADAIALARGQAAEPGRTELLVGAPTGHPVRDLVEAGAMAGTIEDDHRPTGGPMLLPLSPDASALGDELYQALPDRF